ncbi:S41 family peptidase [Candidatus Omnitrophota bacterium]
MNTKRIGVLVGVMVAVFLVSSSIGFCLTRQEKEETYRELELFADALAFVQTQYVDSETAEDLIYGALSGLLAALDPYSQFLDPEDYKELLVETKGTFGGLGVEITIKDGLLTVVSPLEDTPAWRAGLKPGDRIVKIEGELTRGITLTDAVKLLRGDPNTEVKITVLREKERKLFDVVITREIIKIMDIRRKLILEDDVGFIRLAEFREGTVKELDKAIAELEKQGARAYILDLRNNPGGLLDTAVRVTSRFIEPDKLIVYTLNREKKRIEYRASPRIERIIDKPMIVLINQGSASGSEIVAGCLQDYNRAVLLGETSFGKASVQTVLPLSDGSALRLTTARYYTPEGRLIQDKGIVPDITVEAVYNQQDKTKEDEVFEKVEVKEDDNFYKDDNQIMRALDLARGLLIAVERK